MTARDDCAICHKTIGSSLCRHPWAIPFDLWPEEQHKELHQAAPHGWDDPGRGT